jgi:hypothetical protein
MDSGWSRQLHMNKASPEYCRTAQQNGICPPIWFQSRGGMGLLLTPSVRLGLD